MAAYIATQTLMKKILLIVLFTGALITEGFCKPGEIVYKTSGMVSDMDYYIPFYTPVSVPKGATKIAVRQTFSTPSGGKCNIDLGVFDARGHELNSEGFRGWSGGSKHYFEISKSAATPGYLPGRILEGVWNIIQMPTSHTPTINWTLEVTITVDGEKVKHFVKNYARKKLNSIPGWYRIDTHVHSVHSDGANTLKEIMEAGKSAGLDGIVSTDHNTTSSLAQWGTVQDSGFLVINGMEVTYGDGHWNVLGIDPQHWIDFRYTHKDVKDYLATVSRAKRFGGLTVANHPYNINFNYDKTPMDGIEVWNGPWDKTDEDALSEWNRMLVAGIRKFANAGSDYHRSPNILGSPHLVVHAASLSSQDILKSIAKGKSYMVNSSSVSLTMEAWCNSNPVKRVNIGETVVNHSYITIELTTNTSNNTLKIINQNGMVYKDLVKSDHAVNINLPTDSRWVRAELRDKDGKAVALTNPIFIDVR